MSRVQYTVDMEGAASDSCDLLIEAIIENMKIKQEMFVKLDQIAPR